MKVDHIFCIVIGNLAFLYLWMLATGRTILRLRTPEEVSEKTPYTLLRTTGIFFLLSGVLMCVGENGLRTAALGDYNWNSFAFNIAASTAFVLGIFNLVLASKTNINRSLTFLVLLTNALGFIYGTIWITCVARFFQRTCWGMCIYSMDEDFANRWVNIYGTNKALPFGVIATFDLIRTVPIFASVFLTGFNALVLIYAMVKIGMIEEKSTSKIIKKTTKKNYATALTGLGITLVSFLAIKCLCDVNSLLYIRHMEELPLTIIVLTPLGLLGMATLNGCASPWSRALLMTAAASTFITAYTSLNSSTSFENEVAKSFESVLNSNCTGVPSQITRRGYPAPPASDKEPSAQVMEINHNQACFQRKDGWRKIGIVCIDKDKICDGTVDIVEPVEVCQTIPHYYMYTGEVGAHYIDEIFCPSNGINGVTLTIKVVKWLSMLLSLAMVVALAFTFKVNNNEDDSEESVEEMEKIIFLHKWDKFQGTLFSKVSNKEEPTVQQENTPIIKKKLDNPC